jgi:hypothetical protein
MNLFLNAVSRNSCLLLFDDKRTIIDSENFSIYQNESSTLWKVIDNFIKKNKLSYKDIEDIVVVEWPGSFTWIRSIILVVNTLAFAFSNIHLTWISFFNLFDDYPIIKNSSKRDIFFKKDRNEEITLLKNEEFIDFLKDNHINKVFWDFFESDKVFWISVDEKIFYDKIIKRINITNEKFLVPLYIKKPSIS